MHVISICEAYKVYFIITKIVPILAVVIPKCPNVVTAWLPPGRGATRPGCLLVAFGALGRHFGKGRFWTPKSQKPPKTRKSRETATPRNGSGKSVGKRTPTGEVQTLKVRLSPEACCDLHDITGSRKSSQIDAQMTPKWIPGESLLETLKHKGPMWE